MKVGCGLGMRKYLGEKGNLVLDESEDVRVMRAETRRGANVLRGCSSGMEGKMGAVDSVLGPKAMYKFKHRYVRRQDIEELQRPLLVMVREGVRVGSGFARDLLLGQVRHRMGGVECWWDRLMREKLGMLSHMLRDKRWGQLGGVVRVWMNRMMEVSGCRRLLCRGGRVDGRHEQTWLGQMVRWMQEGDMEWRVITSHL